MATAHMPVRQARKRQTRRKLMRAAFGQFSCKGLNATRTVDIARKAGVAHGTVFLHFPTREQLIIEVIEEFGFRVVERMDALARGGKGVREVLAAHLKGLAEYENFYANLIAESHTLPRQTRIALIGIQSAISHHLFETAEREMAEGRIRTIAPHLLFNTWIALLHYYLRNRDLFAPGGSVIVRCGVELLDHYIDMISIH